VYVLEWNPPRASSATERVIEVERIVEVEVPVIVEVPVPVPTPEPPIITIPRPPVPPVPWEPVEPPACDVKPMPERSPWLEKIKCDGSPAQLVPRP
jgi:hypothetical protein